MAIDLIGVPFNSDGTTAGVASAPDALRASGLVTGLRDIGLDVIDRGNVALGPTAPDRDPGSGIIAPAALVMMIAAVRDQVAASTADGMFPLVLGGDCPVLIGCLAGVHGNAPPGLLFVDGHEDAWPPRASTTGEAADMELGLLLGRGRDGLPDDLRTITPELDRSRVFAIGPRDAGELRDAEVDSIEGVVDVLRTEGLTSTALDEPVADRIDRLDRAGPWWLHVDLDVLSTESLAAVDYRQPGGLDWPALTRITRRALLSRLLVGWTVTIYNPDLDPGGSGAASIVQYLSAAWAKDGGSRSRSLDAGASSP
jgi:arginase